MVLLKPWLLKNLGFKNHLLSLEIDDGVLATVLKEVLVGGDAVVGQDLGEAVGAPGVEQVGQELEIRGKPR